MGIVKKVLCGRKNWVKRSQWAKRAEPKNVNDCVEVGLIGSCVIALVWGNLSESGGKRVCHICYDVLKRVIVLKISMLKFREANVNCMFELFVNIVK